MKERKGWNSEMERKEQILEWWRNGVKKEQRKREKRREMQRRREK
jgi:hypothetical protein